MCSGLLAAAADDRAYQVTDCAAKVAVAGLTRLVDDVPYGIPQIAASAVILIGRGSRIVAGVRLSVRTGRGGRLRAGLGARCGIGFCAGRGCGSGSARIAGLIAGACAGSAATAGARRGLRGFRLLRLCGRFRFLGLLGFRLLRRQLILQLLGLIVLGKQIAPSLRTPFLFL